MDLNKGANSKFFDNKSALKSKYDYPLWEYKEKFRNTYLEMVILL